MDENKVKEAIKYASKKKMMYEYALEAPIKRDRENILSLQRGVEVFSTILEALEKQVEKKPSFEGDGYDKFGDIILDEYLCPNCNTRYEVDYQEYDYCPNCGQRIEWRMEE